MTIRTVLILQVITVTIIMGFLASFWSILLNYCAAIAVTVPGFEVVPYGILGLVIIILLYIIKDLFR